jgi:AraC family transcriptional activator of pobA
MDGGEAMRRRSELYAFEGTTKRMPLVVHDLSDDTPRRRAGPHGHDALEILYFSGGNGTQELMGQTWPVAPGDIALVPPGSLHDVSGVSDLTGWAIEFSQAALTGISGAERSLGMWRTSPLLSPFLDAETTPGVGLVRAPMRERGHWEHLLSRMSLESEGRAPGSEQVLGALIVVVLVEIARLVDGQGPDVIFQQEPAVTRTFAAIEAGFAESLTVADIAREVGLTPEHLTTLVRRRTGRPVGEWITERRMAEARLLLTTSDLSADQVARKVGFADASHFSRRFRQLHGSPPGAWRR